MKNMIRLAGCVVAALFAWPCVAAQPPAPRNFSADFTQSRTLPGFDQPLVSEGYVRFDADGELRWVVTAPYTYQFVLEGESAHEILPDGSVRQLAAADAPWLTLVRRIFHAAVDGDESVLKGYFKIGIVNGREHLVPRDVALRGHVQSIDVSGREHPQRITIREAGGGVIDIRFHAPAQSGPAK